MTWRWSQLIDLARKQKDRYPNDNKEAEQILTFGYCLKLLMSKPSCNKS